MQHNSTHTTKSKMTIKLNQHFSKTTSTKTEHHNHLEVEFIVQLFY